MTETLLIVDDEPDLLSGLARTIRTERDLTVLTAGSGEAAIETVIQEPLDLVLADVRMPGMDGIALLEKVKNHDPLVTVIMMTAYGTVETAVQAIKKGAYDFVRKPFDVDRLLHLIDKGLERNRLLRENRKLQQKISAQKGFSQLIGKSNTMTEVYQLIETLAHTDVTILILGETGTGKDLAARAIHERSRRCKSPMVTVNCPALPDGLLESELFGHTKGAFTGAFEDKAGLFEQADGSTIFLDEIGDLSMSLQTKLLRVLQSREVRKLGSDTSRNVDVRIIAATNQNLEEKIRNNQFRADLFYRLNVASITMPSLRDIKEDIPLLIAHCLKKSSEELGRDVKCFSPEMTAYLLEKDWPGNVRELENTIHGWVAMANVSVISHETIPGFRRSSGGKPDQEEVLRPYKDLKNRVIDDFTLNYLDQLFTRTRGNVSLSAQISGIQRQSLQKIINRYGIDVDRYR